MSGKKKGGPSKEPTFRGGSGADDYLGEEQFMREQGRGYGFGDSYGQPQGYTKSSGVIVTPSVPKCSHEGTTPICLLPDTGIELYAASKTWARESAFLADFVIDCGAHIASETQGQFVKAKGTLKEGDKERIVGLNDLIMTMPPVAALDWPDQGIPAGGAAFWLGLVNILPDPGKVLVCCIGGHGRTGTCIASLLLVTNPGLTAKQAIDYTRQRHCKEAIESLAQERYLCALSEQMKRLGARAQVLVLERAQAEDARLAAEETQGSVESEERLDAVPPALDGVGMPGGPTKART